MFGEKGGEGARRGAYFKITTGEFVTIAQDGNALPGGREASYLRMPAPLIMILGPFLGLAYVIFLPLIGILMVAGFVAAKMGQATGVAVRRAALVVAPNWVAGVSYLAKGEQRKGKVSERTVEKGPEDETLLRELEREVAARRQQERENS